MPKKLSEFNFNRTLFLFDYFDQQSSKTLIEGMTRLDQNSTEDINIVINSYGGEVYSLFAILDTINSINSNVNTICLGEADSCGAVLLSAGKERYIGENSRTMIHEISTVAWGKISELKEDLEESSKVNDRMVGILAENTKTDFDTLSELMKKDTFLNASESLDMRLVDFILDDSSLDYEEDAEVKEFVNSFNGRTRDSALAKVVYNSVSNSKPVLDPPKGTKNTKKIIENFSKGDTSMNKNELIAKLKSEFSVDVDAMGTQIADLTAELDKVSGELKDALDASVAAKEELAAKVQKVETDKIEAILSDLIEAGKSSQALNDSIYRDAFTAMGSEEAVIAAEKLPVVVKQSRESGDPANEGAGLSKKEQEHKEISALAKKETLSYSAAASKYYAAKEKSEKGDE